MISHEHIRPRIEVLAKGTGAFTLFALPISTSMTSILFLFTTLMILLSGHWGKKFALIKKNRIALCFLGFFALYLLGTTYSIGSSKEIQYQLLKFSWLLLTPLWMTLFVDDKWRMHAINAFLISMVITLILSFVKYFQWIHSPNFWWILNHRLALSTTITSVFKDYIIQSFLMSLAAIIFLYRFIQRKHWIYAVLFIFAGINILFISPGRTGYIVFIALVAYTLFSQFNFKKALVTTTICAVTLAILLTVFPGTFHQRAQRALQDLTQWSQGDDKTSLGYRLSWELNALKLVSKHPLIGYGTGSIPQAYASLPAQDTAQTGIVNNVSNEYLNITIQFGVIGLLLFLGILLMQWRYSFYLIPEHKFLVQTMLIALCIGNAANSWLMDFTQGYYFALMSALTFSALSKSPKPLKVEDRAYNDDAARDIPS